MWWERERERPTQHGLGPHHVHSEDPQQSAWYPGQSHVEAVQIDVVLPSPSRLVAGDMGG